MHLPFVEFNSVLYYWKKREIALVVTVRCPKCNGEARMEWQGSPIGENVVYPNFGSACWCGNCKKLIPAKVSKKSVLKWIQLSKIQMQKDWNELIHKQLIHRRSEKKKIRKKKKFYPSTQGAAQFAA